ncbi:hypothetical protein BH772_gp009 [Gordonia phage Bachita]|uniref:Uncharacterized protein n=1 Tax=Gordonia phage Bachita TaxID=1838061 RepID=A0A160DI10_9CAUD|nr:hypothetical protein BH772_gp009 [Gordonia phage Bachita]ANA86694.1 hypothetical protein PBI_BACHITA_9 [Gordonia phage Bachita]
MERRADLNNNYAGMEVVFEFDRVDVQRLGIDLYLVIHFDVHGQDSVDHKSEVHRLAPLLAQAFNKAINEERFGHP